jgi:hypothetical protein
MSLSCDLLSCADLFAQVDKAYNVSESRKRSSVSHADVLEQTGEALQSSETVSFGLREGEHAYIVSNIREGDD